LIAQELGEAVAGNHPQSSASLRLANTITYAVMSTENR
jgi:hypothetical protein